MIGRWVRCAGTGEIGEVVAWEPLSAGMCDACVDVQHPWRRGRVWYGSSDLRPIDSEGPLPRREDEVRRVRAEMRAQLQVLHARQVQRVQTNPLASTGMPFMDGLYGMALDRALEDLERDTCAD